MKRLAEMLGLRRPPAKKLADEKRARERVLRANGCSRCEARRIVAQTLGNSRGRDGQ